LVHVFSAARYAYNYYANYARVSERKSGNDDVVCQDERPSLYVDQRRRREERGCSMEDVPHSFSRAAVFVHLPQSYTSKLMYIYRTSRYMYNMPPPAPLAAAPHAERVRGSIAIGLSGLGLYEDAQCRRETTVRIFLSPRGRSMQCKCLGLSAWPSRVGECTHPQFVR